MSLPTIAAFEKSHGPLTPAETALITACKAGKDCVVGDGELPPEGKPDPTREVRAALLRLLILGGNEADGLDPKGVWVEGAHVTGELDLSFQKARGQCGLLQCRFEKEPSLEQTTLEQLTLDGSTLPGCWASGVSVSGSVFLRRITASSTVAMSSAKVGGQVDCTGATLDGEGDMALNAQGLDCGQDLFLSEISANGTVELSGAKVGGQVSCPGATLDTKGGDALRAQRLRVAEGLFFRDLKSVTGQVYLDSAHVGDLYDDGSSWPTGKDEVYLDGFTYDRIGEHAPITFVDRKDWLARGSRYQGHFHPQPYTQFAKVLRESGNAGEARKVLAERDRLVFQEVHRANRRALALARLGQGDVGRAWMRLRLTQVWDWFTRVFSGYGHAPHYALFWSLGLVGAGAVWFFIAWQAGVMVPNSPVIMTSYEWRSAVVANPLAPSHDWVANASAATHYETFYSLPFALDTYAPLVSMGQEEAWAATTTTTFGWLTRWFTFGFKIAGWAISALGLAAITGFVQKNQPD